MSAVMSKIKLCQFRHQHTRIIGKSPFSGKSATAHMLDWQWQFRFTYRPLAGADLLALQAELAAAELGGTVVVWHPDFPRAWGSAATGAVNGASQLGTTLVTDGWPVSSALAVAGDYVFVRMGTPWRMFRLLSAATSNGAGQASFVLDAPLPGSPADNAVVTFDWVAQGAGLTSIITAIDEGESDELGTASITITGEELV